jgi:hypothetical protein
MKTIFFPLSKFSSLPTSIMIEEGGTTAEGAATNRKKKYYKHKYINIRYPYFIL